MTSEHPSASLSFRKDGGKKISSNFTRCGQAESDHHYHFPHITRAKIVYLIENKTFFAGNDVRFLEKSYGYGGGGIDKTCNQTWKEGYLFLLVLAAPRVREMFILPKGRRRVVK